MRHRWTRAAKASRLVGVAIGLLVVGLYGYNSIRHNAPSLRGDQWFWVTNVLVPYEDGRMSLFDAITFEYQSFAHSHIPTLITFIATEKWFGLTSTVDTLVGFLSLTTVLALILRYSRARLDDGMTQLALLAVTSILFMSSSTSNFVWSLLQFQMFYVLVGVAYLFVIARQINAPTMHRLAPLAIPAAMVLGDSMGAAAVAASLLYLALLVALRRVSWRAVVPYYVVFVVSVLLLGRLLRGQRQHGGSSALDFVDFVFTNPVDVATSFYYAIAQAFVGLQGQVDAVELVSWDFALPWFMVTMVVLAGICVGLRRGGLERRDHVPLMLMIASLVWTLGVVRARGFLGPTVMQQPRYAAYTTVFGVGAALLVAGKWRFLGRGRPVVAAALVLVIAANTVGSVAISRADDGEVVQDREISLLRAYVEGENQTAPSLGLACSDWAPCLEGAWFLWDRRLGPFTGDPERPEWLVEYRDAIYDRWHDAEDQEKQAICVFIDSASPAELRTDIESNDGLAPFMSANGVLVPEGSLDEATEILSRAMSTECRSFALQTDAAHADG